MPIRRMFSPAVRRLAALTASALVVSAWIIGVPPAAADPTAPADFVALADVDPTILQDIRYATAHNFTGDPVDGYRAPMCILTRPAAEALARAQHDFLERGYTLKVYDCFRPQRAVDDFVDWAADLADERMKAEFYPRVDKSVLFSEGYIAERSGHSRGSTVDLTLVALPAAEDPTQPYQPGQLLVDCAAPQQHRFPDDSIDMGTGFDCFDTLANTWDPRIEGDALKNRLLLTEGLERQGFVNYDKEWWHFTYRPGSPGDTHRPESPGDTHRPESPGDTHEPADRGEPYPDTFFDFPVEPQSLGR